MCFVRILSHNSEVFQHVKQIAFIEVARKYLPELRKQGNRWVARCPFHDDKRPSLVIYANGFHCFSCQAHGDAVDIVARLHNLRPLEAARQICRDFGLPVPGDTPQARQEARQRAKQALRERQQREAQRIAEQVAYEHLSAFYRVVDKRLIEIRTINDLESIGGLYPIRTILENVLETLRCGTQEEKRQALDDALRRWGV